MITITADKIEKDVQVQVHPSQINQALLSLPTLEVLDGVEHCFKKAKRLPLDSYLVARKWKQDEELYGGGHSRTRTEVLREATEHEVEVMIKMSELRKLIEEEELSNETIKV